MVDSRGQGGSKGESTIFKLAQSVRSVAAATVEAVAMMLTAPPATTPFPPPFLRPMKFPSLEKSKRKAERRRLGVCSSFFLPSKIARRFRFYLVFLAAPLPADFHRLGRTSSSRSTLKNGVGSGSQPPLPLGLLLPSSSIVI